MSKRFILASALLVLGTRAVAADRIMPIEPPMVDIKGGEFMMGSMRRENSQPVHAVTLKPFRMGKYEVTAEEFRRFVQATGYQTPAKCFQFELEKEWLANQPNHQISAATPFSSSKFQPAVCVGWAGADAYVKWLAQATGKHYRLPTEAEWEYAHRAGSSHRYFYGNDESLACRYANLADRSAAAALKRDFGTVAEHVGVTPCDDKAGYASIVGMYQANAFGLHDTLGNVAEYVQICARPDYRDAAADGRAPAAGDCSQRVLRGGAWHFRGPHFSERLLVNDFVGFLEGFRVAQNIGTDAAVTKPSAFEIALAEAQKIERARRSAAAEIVPAGQ